MLTYMVLYHLCEETKRKRTLKLQKPLNENVFVIVLFFTSGESIKFDKFVNESQSDCLGYLKRC